MNDQCSFHFLDHSMKDDKDHYVKRVISVVLNVDFVKKMGRDLDRIINFLHK